jgi:glycine hydroxymethyltransferase
MANMLTYQSIQNLISEHESWRSECMNLIASENALSPAVRKALDNDFVQRYGNYQGRNLNDRRYSGNRFIKEIEIGLEGIVKGVFGASEVELRAISGHIAGLAVIMACCKPGDTVLEISSADGGHRLAGKAAESPLIHLNVLPIPFNPHEFNVDVQATCDLIKKTRPKLIILGLSNFLFPCPTREIATYIAQFPNMVLAYDASHVFGLIACGEFQDPLREGADVVFGSTHKTLPGPQGGLILSNNAALMETISTAVYPATVTNHHLMRSPALGIALLEMKSNPGYARQVIKNAQALGKRLFERGVPLVAAQHGFTRSHTILISTTLYGTGKDMAARLEEANIMSSYTKLPKECGTEGVRFGTAEITRRGAVEKDVIAAADIIADVLQAKIAPDKARGLVKVWAGRLEKMKFIKI